MNFGNCFFKSSTACSKSFVSCVASPSADFIFLKALSTRDAPMLKSAMLADNFAIAELMASISLFASSFACLLL